MTQTKPPSAKRNRRTSKSTLAVIGALLLMSAAIRLATEAGQVVANESSDAPTAADASQSSAMDLSRPEQMDAALEAIKKREAKLIDREAEIDEREASISKAETSIKTELAKLKTAEENLKRTIERASAAAEEDISQLTDVYATMKPKQAAALFEQMDSNFAAGFLARMAANNAARIMAGMTPEKAYEISVVLAGRNADIPLD
jgi:flagellar motility protein MotE (MotC chaperone)